MLEVPIRLIGENGGGNKVYPQYFEIEICTLWSIPSLIEGAHTLYVVIYMLSSVGKVIYFHFYGRKWPFTFTFISMV